MEGYFENEYARFSIIKGILFFEYKAGLSINLEVARQVVADRIHFQKEKAYPIFCDSNGLVAMDKAGRDYLAQYGSMLAKAVALYSNDNVARVLSYFYLMVSKPEVPTKRFTDKDAALQFLEKYK